MSIDKSFSNKNMEQFQSELKLVMQGQIFKSIEEANDFLKKYQEKRNNTGVKAFCGLSPSQMQIVLYQPLSIGRFIRIDTANPFIFEQTQLITQAYFLLNKIHASNELKLTEKGNLPRALVKEFWFLFNINERYSFEPNREEDCPELTRLKCLLDYAGLIQKRSKKLRLSKKGFKILNEKRSADLYVLLVEAYFNDWNWSYMDRYSENQIIQMAGQFSLMLISELAQDWISVEEIGNAFVRAFPGAVNDAQDLFDLGTPEESLIRCLSTRFLDRVCLPLGIIEWENIESPFTKLSDKFKVTEFFKNTFSFDTIF